MNFKNKSMRFLANETDSYNPQYETSFLKDDWKQIEVGSQHKSDNHTRIFYCGGSVSSIDWAPSDNGTHFMAVACNSCGTGIKINLVQTIKSCVQIYEFQSLVNDK